MLQPEIDIFFVNYTSIEKEKKENMTWWKTDRIFEL